MPIVMEKKVLDLEHIPVSDYSCFLDSVGVMDAADWEILHKMAGERDFVYACERNQHTGHFYFIHFSSLVSKGQGHAK